MWPFFFTHSRWQHYVNSIIVILLWLLFLKKKTPFEKSTSAILQHVLIWHPSRTKRYSLWRGFLIAPNCLKWKWQFFRFVLKSKSEKITALCQLLVFSHKGLQLLRLSFQFGFYSRFLFASPIYCFASSVCYANGVSYLSGTRLLRSPIQYANNDFLQNVTTQMPIRS